ncbi:MAG TPA: chlorite dismutase family protein [Myxococcales bacterium]|nr:chlorite dismutase family protein [Myxococcales bacterium]
MDPIPVLFVAGAVGDWRIDRVAPVRGEALPSAPRLARLEGAQGDLRGIWTLRGTTSHERYVTRAEKEALRAVQPALGRADSTHAALIPVRKSKEWWDLAQDERRRIFEEQSRHVSIGLRYLPAVARRLYHCRDLGGPFDFLTWFEYAERDADRFEELVGELRRSPEWDYVEREVDVRVSR